MRFDWGDPASWTAADAGVARAVLLSARAVEFLPGGVVAATERTMAQAPLPHTILRPSHFAQNFTEAMFAPVDGVVRAPVGGGAEPFIDVRDIAEVAAEVLSRGGFEGEAIELSGPAALDFPEAVAALASASDTTLRFEEQDREDHIAALRTAGTPELYIEWRMAMLDAIRRGADAYLSDGVERVLGRGATPFAEWAAREAGPGPASA